jgi:hypothetical protein
MLRRISVVAACVAVLALSALPAAAATSRIHTFSIPGVYGVRAWGTYVDVRTKVQITVCVQDTARNVYGAGTVGLVFTSNYQRHNSVGAVTIGYDQTQCHAMVTPYTAHLVVAAFSGGKGGKVHQNGKPRRIY